MKNIMLMGKNMESFDFISMKKIIILFKDSCGYLLNGINIIQIAEGIIIMIKDIVEIELNDINQIIDFVKNKTIYMDWEHV